MNDIYTGLIPLKLKQKEPFPEVSWSVFGKIRVS